MAGAADVRDCVTTLSAVLTRTRDGKSTCCRKQQRIAPVWEGNIAPATRLTIVQYAGDYREAFERFEGGGKATYQAQRYSVGFVGSLAKRLEQVTVVCALGSADDILLPDGVRAIRAGLQPGFHPREVVPAVARTNPDRLLLTTPMVPLLKWARKERIRTATTLADSFQLHGIRNIVHNRRLARELNGDHVEWVGNHGIGACLSLRAIGVKPDKIIPWDWPPSHSPSDHAPRTLRGTGRVELVYVGSLSEAKGVGDLLEALTHLISEPRPHLTVIGKDPDGHFQQRAAALGLGQQVHFAGLVPNEDVPAAMRQADIVVIASRHDYPEGLPLTIYEALAARTPIIASDHPMFRGALVDGESALVFPAGESQALAAAIQRLSVDRETYERLSTNSETAWRTLQLPVTWGAFIEKWLSGAPADKEWLKAHRLTSGIYDAQIAARSN